MKWKEEEEEGGGRRVPGGRGIVVHLSEEVEWRER